MEDGKASRQGTKSRRRFNKNIKLGVSENTTRCKGGKLGNQNLGEKKKREIGWSMQVHLGEIHPTQELFSGVGAGGVVCVL